MENKSLAYAVDLVAESDTREQAESYLTEQGRVFGQAQLEISTEKTEIMSINKDCKKPIMYNGKELKDVDPFEYLRSLVSKDGLAHSVVRKGRGSKICYSQIKTSIGLVCIAPKK